MKAVHAPGCISLGHLLVQDAAAGGHPLHVARRHPALVAQAVAVRHFPRQHIGDGLNAPVRMPRKSSHVVRRILIAKIVQQQKRIELLGLPEAKGALQLHPCSLDGWFGFKYLLHCAKRHR